MIALPCGGTGELRPKTETRVRCEFHRVWQRTGSGQWATAFVGGALVYLYEDTPSCGAVTDLDPRTGQRVIVPLVEVEEEKESV